MHKQTSLGWITNKQIRPGTTIPNQLPMMSNHSYIKLLLATHETSLTAMTFTSASVCEQYFVSNECTALWWTMASCEIPAVNGGLNDPAMRNHRTKWRMFQQMFQEIPKKWIEMDGLTFVGYLLEHLLGIWWEILQVKTSDSWPSPEPLLRPHPILRTTDPWSFSEWLTDQLLNAAVESDIWSVLTWKSYQTIRIFVGIKKKWLSI